MALTWTKWLSVKRGMVCYVENDLTVLNHHRGIVIPIVSKTEVVPFQRQHLALGHKIVVLDAHPRPIGGDGQEQIEFFIPFGIFCEPK